MIPVTLVIVDTATPLYLSDGMFVSRSTDAIGLVVFQARLVGEITFKRSARNRLMSQQRATGGIGAIRAINNDGALDALCYAEAVKGVRVRIYTGFQGQAFDDFTLAATTRIDRVQPRGEAEIEIVTTSLLTELDTAFNPALYEAGDDVAGSVINRPRPVAIGHPKSCPIPLVDAVDYEYDCHDDADWRDVTMVRDAGYPLTEGTGYRRAVTAGRFGIEKLALPTGRVVADVRGAAEVTEIIGATPGDFASGLTGWSTSVTGDGACTAESGGCRISGGAAGTAKIFINSTLEEGGTYRWSIASATRTSGDLVILSGADVVATLGATGAASGYFTADADEAFGIAKGAAAASWLIDGVRLERLVQYSTLAECVRYVISRGPLTIDDIDDASLDALSAACPWPMSMWIDSGARALDVLYALLDSVCGWVFEGRDGKLHFGRATRPVEGTPSFAITADMIVRGTEVNVRPDEAPGLSRIVCGGRNWYRYGDDEVADGVSDADRALITADYRVRSQTALAVNDEVEGVVTYQQVGTALLTSDGRVGQARPASDIGMDTLLDEEADCESLADYCAGLYPDGERQRFFEVEVFLSPTEIVELDPGAIGTFTFPRYGLDAGPQLLLLDIEGVIGRRRTKLTLWGAPEATP
jgi:hypothetical protein